MSDTKKKYKIGYTQGAFDMFHIGHLNLIRNAKAQCEKLVVGVNSDELIEKYKKKTPIICETDRVDIISALKYVDRTVLVSDLDKGVIYNEIPFDAIFIGDDWKGNQRWIETEQQLNKLGAEVVYLKYTEGISSTMLREISPKKKEK